MIKRNFSSKICFFPEYLPKKHSSRSDKQKGVYPVTKSLGYCPLFSIQIINMTATGH